MVVAAEIFTGAREHGVKVVLSCPFRGNVFGDVLEDLGKNFRDDEARNRSDGNAEGDAANKTSGDVDDLDRLT